MDSNIIIGYVLVVLGLIAMSGGIAIAIVDALRPPRATPASVIEPIKDLIEAIAKLLAELAKFRPGIQLLLLGIAIFVGGLYIIDQKPL